MINIFKLWYFGHARDLKGKFNRLPDIKAKLDRYDRKLNKLNMRIDLHEFNKYKMIIRYGKT